MFNLKGLRRKGIEFTWKPVGGGYSVAQPRDMMYQAYRLNSVAAACIRMIATSAPEAPADVFLRDKDGKLDKVDNHWFKELMRHPNDWMSTYDLWEQTFIHMLGSGSAYWLLMRRGDRERGPIDEVRLLRPDLVEPILDASGELVGWKYTPGTGQEFKYPVWQVLAFQLPDPFNPHRGLSPMAHVINEAGVDNAATDFVKQFFDNAAIPAGYLKTDQDILEEEAEAAEERWYQRMGRKAKKLFRTPVLGSNLEYHQMAMNFSEMEFDSVRSITETRICMAFGVDPLLLPSWVGLKHNNTKASYVEARKHLWEETIVPLLRRIEDKINSQIFIYEPNAEMRFDLSEIEALQENATEKWARYLDAWDKGTIKLGDLQKSLGIPLDTERQDEYKAEPQLEYTPPESDEKDEQGQEGSEEDNNTQKALQLRRKDVSEKDLAKLRDIQDMTEEEIGREAQDFFGETARKVVESTQNYSDILMSYLAVKEAIATAEQQLAGRALQLFRAAAILGGETAKEIFDIDFNPNDENLAEKIRQYTDTFTRVVMEGVRKDMASIVDEANREGWEMDRVREEIRGRFEEYSENKVDRIARTESIRLTNLGTTASYLQAGFFRMAWFTHEDEKTCPFCNKMDGTVKHIGAPFATNGETITHGEERMRVSLGDVLHPPLHPNCRCSVIPV